MYALGVIVVCTPIVCMPDVMHVWQQVAALGSSSRQMRAGLGACSGSTEWVIRIHLCLIHPRLFCVCMQCMCNACL